MKWIIKHQGRVPALLRTTDFTPRQLLCLLFIAVASSSSYSRAASETARLDLEACISIALENNERRPASRFALEMAEAQHRQALAAYWPQATLNATYTRSTERPNFIFPERRFSLPASTSVINVPAGVLGPNPVALPVNVPEQTLTVPDQKVELLGKNLLTGSLDVSWLLFDGGMRLGRNEKAKAGIRAAREEVRRTELEIVDSVKRAYYGAILARQLKQLGEDALARMDATLELTQSMYQEGAGGVKKTDFLANKVVVESIRSLVATLEQNEILARAALANFMGRSWRDSVIPMEESIAFQPLDLQLDTLVSSAYRFNPDWNKMKAGLSAASGELRQAKSGHRPRVALFGKIQSFLTNLDDGLNTNANQKNWTVGVNVEVPIFDGFLTRHEMRYARAKLRRLESQQVLLEEGVGLQVRSLFVQLNTIEKQFSATKDAMDAAIENRDLNERAYRNQLTETEDVIQAQFIESLTASGHYRVVYEHMSLQSQLDLVVGTEVLKLIGELGN